MIWPKIWLACVSCTRLSVTEVDDGCAKLTCAWLPTLKVAQSITPRWLAWLTFMRLPDCEIAMLPAATLPPVGNWPGAGATAWAQAPEAMPSPANSVAASLLRPLALPRPRAFSATATQVPWASFHTRR